MKDKPGHLKDIARPLEWLDLVFKSDLSYAHKLVASVIARSSGYNRKHRAALSYISLYNISRILKMNPKEVEELVQLLINNGWLFDTENTASAAKVYALTFSLLPLNELKQ